MQEQVANKMQEWFESGLQQWDISRGAPYFGFEIPERAGQIFFTSGWIPIGYMGSFKNLCDKRDAISYFEECKKDSNAELYHFIGKDHRLLPQPVLAAMLEGSNPQTDQPVHG